MTFMMPDTLTLLKDAIANRRKAVWLSYQIRHASAAVRSAAWCYKYPCKQNHMCESAVLAVHDNNTTWSLLCFHLPSAVHY